MEKVIKSILFTKLVDGEIVVFIRHYYPSAYKGRLAYSVSEDTVISRTPVWSPIPMWDKLPFLDYHKEFAGRLSYKDYCKEVDKDSIWVFNNFTTCSDGMYQEVCRTC